MTDETKRDVKAQLRLSFIPIGGYRRENECQFCGQTKAEPMIRMTYDGEGACVELEACGECLAAVGVRDILPAEETA